MTTSAFPVIIFDEEKHAYTVDGDLYPSVTEIIDKTVPIPFNAGAWYGWKLGARAMFEAAWNHGLPEKFEDMEVVVKDTDHRPDRILKTAGDRGTDVHKAIERWGLEYEPLNPKDFPPEDRQMVKGLSKWLIDNEPEFYDAEIRTAHTLHRYAGTLDAHVMFHKGEHKGKTARLDWKTGSRFYPDRFFPQIIAYDTAERFSGKGEVDMCGIVHIPEGGKVKCIPCTDTFDDFLVLLMHYNSIQHRRNRNA